MRFKLKLGLLKASTIFRSSVFSVVAMAGLASAAYGDAIQVSEVVAKQNATTKVSPVLPPIAKQAHLSGRVVVELSIAEDGSVTKTDVVSGNPILGMAASKAAKGWSFKPFSGADGKPSPASVKLTFDFENR